MAGVKVTTYYARWNPVTHSGFVQIYWDGGFRSFSEFTVPTEFQVIVDLLRNEKPIWWDDVREHISTGSGEPVGEGE